MANLARVLLKLYLKESILLKVNTKSRWGLRYIWSAGMILSWFWLSYKPEIKIPEYTDVHVPISTTRGRECYDLIKMLSIENGEKNSGTLIVGF